MSYILDALRKADEDRNLAAVPAFDVGQQAFSDARPITLWPWLLLLALVVNAIAIVAFYQATRDHRDSPAPTTTASASSAASRAASLNAPVVPADTRTATTAAPAPAGYLPVMKNVEPVAVAAPAPASDNPSRRLEPPVEYIEAETLRPAQAAQAASQTPATRPSPQPILAEFSDTAAPPQPLKRLAEMDAAFRDAFPALTIDAHVYNSRAAKRFVMINLTRYREGDRLKEGPLLVGIRRDGVALNFREQMFLLPLGAR